MITFKELMAIPSPEGETDDQAYLRYRAQKRRRGVLGGTIGGPVGESVEQTEDMIDEAFTMQQRLQKSRSMKRNKSKVKLGRERALRKTADMGTIKRRAQKHARLSMFKKLSKGLSPSEVPFAKRQEIEKRLDKMKPRIERVAKKLIPQIRKIEKERKQSRSQGSQSK